MTCCDPCTYISIEWSCTIHLYKCEFIYARCWCLSSAISNMPYTIHYKTKRVVKHHAECVWNKRNIKHEKAVVSVKKEGKKKVWVVGKYQWAPNVFIRPGASKQKPIRYIINRLDYSTLTCNTFHVQYSLFLRKFPKLTCRNCNTAYL